MFLPMSMSAISIDNISNAVPASSPLANTVLEIISGFSNTALWLVAEPIVVTIPSPTRASIVSSHAHFGIPIYDADARAKWLMKNDDVHFIALDSSKVVGIVVLVPDYKPGVGKLRQMATAEHVRGQGYGVALVQALEKHATEIGIEKIALHSRHYAVGFYEKLDYRVTSDVFQEVGMDHFAMEKQL